PTREVLLDKAQRDSSAPLDFRGRAQVVEHSFNRVAMEAELSAPGYLVLTEAYVPGWTASVDGVPSDVLRANTAFRAVRVPSGKHEIELNYRPMSVTLGCAFTFTGLLAGAFLWARSGPPRSRRLDS